MKLDAAAYHELCHMAKGESQDTWYELSYGIFTKHPLDTMEDFWKLVAMAYSWMPTIPGIHKEHARPGLIRRLNTLKAAKAPDDKLIAGLINELVPVINNSLVGTSKVLHFINPGLVPIIDSNVICGWNIFFKRSKKKYEMDSLPSTLYRKDSYQPSIEKYITYQKEMLDWKQACGKQVSLRQIEMALFELGRKELKKRKALKKKD